MAKRQKYGGRRAGTPNKATGEIRELARAYAPAAIKELARLAKDAESEQARVSAIGMLLDRGYGKSPQAMEHSGPNGGPIDLVSRLLGDIDGKTRALNEKAE